MRTKWEILSHPTGHWVINTGTQRLVMRSIPAKWLWSMNGKSPQSGEVLHCLRFGNEADQAGWSDAEIIQVARRLEVVQSSEALHHSRRVLWGRLPLISARLTRVLAKPLEFCMGKWGLTVLGLCGLGGPLILPWATGGGPSEAALWFPAFLLFFTGAIIHELGHAAALSAQGYPAGGIGAGILFVIPVLHNDVSAVSMLPVGGKLRVDMAGVAVQSAYGGLLVVGAGLWPGAASTLLFAAKMTWLAVGWSLIPFIRADGYWALSDVLGLKDLRRPLEEPLGRWRMVVLLAHRILNIVFLIVVSVVLPLSWSGRLGAMVAESWRVGVLVALGGVVGFMWWSVGRRILGLARALVADVLLVRRRGL